MIQNKISKLEYMVCSVHPSASIQTFFKLETEFRYLQERVK